MFSHCGAWCLFDYEMPDTISYHWSKEKKCWSQAGSTCENIVKEKQAALDRKEFICGEETCLPVAPSLSTDTALRHCETTSKSGEDRSTDAKGCHDSYTPYVQRSIANKMFSHCGAWCLYDVEFPDKVSYGWDNTLKCWNRGSGCQGNPEQKLAIQRKEKFCKADLCIPVQKHLSPEVMKTHCTDLSTSGEDRSQHAQACKSSESHEVHKALANAMFSHCGAWCLFSFDHPDKVSWGWNKNKKCWEKGGCHGHEEQQKAIEKRKKFCKD